MLATVHSVRQLENALSTNYTLDICPNICYSLNREVFMSDDNAFIHMTESAPGRIKIVLQESV